MAQLAEKLALWPRPTAESPLVLGPSPVWQIFRSLGKWVTVAGPDEQPAASDLQGGLLGVGFLS